MKPLKTHISLSIDIDVLEQIKKLAEEDDRATSSYINLILRKHIEEKSRKN